MGARISRRSRTAAALSLAVATLVGTMALVPAVPNVVVAAPVAPAPAADAINGLVWLDANADGVNNTAEQPFAGVTVRLLDATDTEIASVVTPASGVYSFPGLTAGAPWRVQVDTPALYTISVGGADNDLTRGALPNVGRSAPIEAGGVTVDAAVRPQWLVELGTFSDGPFTGAAPFATDATSNCPATYAPGDDCSQLDNIVRTGDTVNFLWSVSASNPEGGLPGTLADVVFEQTIVPAPGANVVPGALPVECNAANGGGTPPPTSRITVNADRSITLVCNLGSWPVSGTAKLFQFDVNVAKSANGSTFTSTGVAYSTAGEVTGGNATARPVSVPNAVASSPVTDVLTVSAAFKYDLNKVVGMGGTTSLFFDPDGPGPEPELRGVQRSFSFGVSSPTKAVEPLQQPITFVDDVFFAGPNPLSTTPFAGGDLEHYILNCGPNGQLSTALPWGVSRVNRPLNPERSVENSGTCSFARTGGNTSPYTFTLNGIDDSGVHYPTRYGDGSGDLTNGPFFVAAYIFNVFIPDRAIDRFDGVVGNSTGNGFVYNRIADFSPVSVTGQENYGGAGEPGFCDPARDIYSSETLDTGCVLMPSGAGSNNVAGPVEIRVTPAGYQAGLNKSFVRPVAGDFATSGFVNPRGVAIGHDGAGVVAPTEIVLSRVQTALGNEVGSRGRDLHYCDVFDNTTLQIAEAAAAYSAAPANTFTWVRPQPGQPDVLRGTVDADWIYEYGSFPFPGDNPLYKGSQAGGTIDSAIFGGVDSYNPATRRFEGIWDAQRSVANSCGTAVPPGGWQPSPTTVPGGLDAVNAVRIRPAFPNDVYGQTNTNETSNVNFFVPLRPRNNFNGGPYDGQLIPDSTVLANMAAGQQQRADNPNLPVRVQATVYQPSPENVNQQGDRVTMERASLSLAKNSITVDGVGSGASAVNVTGNANAGDTIVWQLQPAASSPTDYPLTGIQVVDDLPVTATYDAACTSTIAGGTLPATVQLNTPSAGLTRLTWNLPNQTANTPMPTFRFCTRTDPTVPAGTNVVNTASVTAAGIANAGTDDHTVALSQPGAIVLQKTVDAALDPLDDDQNYQLRVRNVSAVAPMQAVKVIDVFPHNGDATNSAGVNRTPGSVFDGTLRLAAAPTAVFADDFAVPEMAGTMLYTADAPATVNQNWNLNTSRWCSFNGTTFTGVSGTGACPSTLANVTAIKFEATEPLLPNAQASGTRDALTINVRLQAANNRGGNLYANRFTVSTPSVRESNTPDSPLQLLQSNRVQVEVVQFAVGDIVFVDNNDNGRFDIGDTPAPAGVVVQLWTPGPDGVIGGGDDRLRQSTTTGVGGTYLFNQVGAGQVYVQIPASQFAAGQPLAPWTPSTIVGVEDADDNVSQDGSSTGGALVSTIHTLSFSTPNGVAVGAEPLGDNRRNLVLPDGVTDAFTNLTIDFAVVPTSALGDYVWFDANGDGVQDGTEQPIAGVTVTALWAGPDGILDTTDDVTYADVTDGSGAYLFEDIPGGTYRVTTSNVSAGFAPTFDLDGLTTPDTATVTLATGQSRLDVDFGYAVAFSLGNRVWSDRDGNGRYDAAVDANVPDGVTVELRRGDGTLVTTTTTSSGIYGFDGLAAGEYFVAIPASMFAAGGPLAGWDLAPNGVADPNDDEDDGDDHNAQAVNVATIADGVRTGTVTLSATLNAATGAITGNEPGGFVNDTLDLALAAPAEISIEKEVCTPGATCAPDAPLGSGGWTETALHAFEADVTWRIIVTNTGTQDLVTVTVTDAAEANCDRAIGDLAVGASNTYTCTTSALVEAIEPNTADARGVGAVTSVVVTDSDTASATLPEAAPAVSIVKFINGNDANTAPGAEVAYTSTMAVTFDVTNTGNVRLDPVVVTDDVIAAADISCPLTSLAPGEAMTCTATLPAPDPGVQHTNIGLVTGTPIPLGEQQLDDVTDDDPANAIVPAGSVIVAKSIVGPEFDPAQRYSFTVSCSISEIDVVLGEGDAEFQLAADETRLVSGIPVGSSCVIVEIDTSNATSTTVTVDAQPAVDGVEATVTVDGDRSVTFENTFVPREPAITIVKSINGDDANTAPGVTVGYASMMQVTYDVTNSGNTPLDNVVVTDDQIAAADISCPQVLLAVGETMQCTATHPAPSPGVQHTNIGTVTGRPVVPAGPQPADVTDNDPANAIVPAGALTVTKAVTGTEDTPRFAYGFTVACTSGDKVVAMTPAAFTLAAGAKQAVSGVPLDAQCVVTETATGGADQTASSVAGSTATPSASSIAVTVGSEVVVDFVNTFAPPTPAAAAKPTTPTRSYLSITGSGVQQILLLAGVLLAAGLALTVVRRRRSVA